MITGIQQLLRKRSLLQGGLLHIKGFPSLSTANPNFAISGVRVDTFSSGFALVMSQVVDQGAVRPQRGDLKIFEGVSGDLEFVDHRCFSFLVAEPSGALLNLTKTIIE